MTDRDSSESAGAAPFLEPDMFRVALEAAPNPIVVVKEDGTMAIVNVAAEKLFGYQASELIGQHVELLLPEGLHIVHQGHRAEFIKAPAAKPMGQERDLFVIIRDGSPVPVEIGLSPVNTSSGLLIICSIVDISPRKRTEEDLSEFAAGLGKKNDRLLQLVATDSLTLLKSRQAFMDHLTAQLEASVRHARPLSILFLDIDNFKAYNDTFGHQGGDEVLKMVGKALRVASRRSDVVARLGGEEFGIILPETDKKGATIFAERFRAAIEVTQWPLRPVTISVGATTIDFGGAVPRPDHPTVSEILAEADRALYQSKELGRNRVTHSADFSKPTPVPPTP